MHPLPHLAYWSQGRKGLSSGSCQSPIALFFFFESYTWKGVLDLSLLFLNKSVCFSIIALLQHCGVIPPAPQKQHCNHVARQKSARLDSLPTRKNIYDLILSINFQEPSVGPAHWRTRPVILQTVSLPCALGWRMEGLWCRTRVHMLCEVVQV